MSNRNSFIESTKETDKRLEVLKQLYPEIFSDGKLNLDLSSAIKDAVMRIGVREDNFFDSCPCTKESDNLCSWRRDNPIRQSMLTGIMLVK